MSGYGHVLGRGRSPWYGPTLFDAMVARRKPKYGDVLGQGHTTTFFSSMNETIIGTLNYPKLALILPRWLVTSSHRWHRLCLHPLQLFYVLWHLSPSVWVKWPATASNYIFFSATSRPNIVPLIPIIPNHNLIVVSYLLLPEYILHTDCKYSDDGI